MQKQQAQQQIIKSFFQPGNKTIQTISGLKILQEKLKRQFLLLEREQREKAKIKKQIQHSIQDYYSNLVEKKGLGIVVTQDKLSNSYNFVKDFVLNVSKDVKLGFEILCVCQQQTVKHVSPLLVGMFYQNFSQNDPYLKKNTVFAQLLGKKISLQLYESDANFMKKPNQLVYSKSALEPKTKIILSQFCLLQSIKQYFQMLANKILNKIPHSLRRPSSPMAMSRGSVSGPDYQNVSIIQLSQSQSISVNRSRSNSFISITEQEIESKIDQAVQDYKADICNKAEMMPISLRVLIYHIFNELSKLEGVSKDPINKFIWEVLQSQYFRPFDTSHPKKWNHFKNSYFSQTVNKICEIMRKKADSPFRAKLVQKLISINKEKLNKKQEQEKKKIVINGGCVSYMNLYYLFKVVKQNQKKLKSLNERVTNRVNKINQMNPNFQFYRSFKDPKTSFLVFYELIYGELLEKDYLSMYNSIYNDHKVKNMLKQILSDNTFHIFPYIQREDTLKQIFQKIIKEQQTEGDGNFSLGALQHSPQFIMKIKYLVYLMNDSKKNKIDEVTLFCEMIQQCLQRHKSNLFLFQKNKIQLLKCLTTVNKAKKIVKNQKQLQKSIQSHLKIVKILDTMQLNVCITSPSTRPQKEKYIKSQNQGIRIQSSGHCQHQQNIIEGLKHHANNVQQSIMLYCDLREVRIAMETGKDSFKVNESLNQLLDLIKDKCRIGYHVNAEEYGYFENSVSKVVFRQIHQILIDNTQKSLQQIQFHKILKDFSFLRPAKIKITNRDNLAQLEQVWQIACRYLKNLNEKKNPQQKIQSLLQMIEVIKISIRKQKGDKMEIFDQNSIQIILAYCLIRSRPQKILLNINFIQVFLCRQKMLAKQGAALGKLKNAVQLITNKKLGNYLIIDEPQFEQQLFRTYTQNQVQDMKESQKVLKSLAYI